MSIFLSILLGLSAIFGASTPAESPTAPASTIAVAETIPAITAPTPVLTYAAPTVTTTPAPAPSPTCEELGMITAEDYSCVVPTYYAPVPSTPIATTPATCESRGMITAEDSSCVNPNFYK